MGQIDILKYLYRRPQHFVIHLFSNIFSKKLDYEKLNNVLIISPHPDDEIFGCAGLMQLLIKQNKKVNILYLSQGESSLPQRKYKKEEIIEKRRQLAIKANRILGLEDHCLHFLDFPDGDFKNATNEQIEKCQTIIRKINPQALFYPHPYEGSLDHRIATEIVTKILLDTDITQYYYCVWLWHHMPMYKAFMLRYRQSYIVMGYDCSVKRNVMDIYTTAKTTSGDFYSGALPKMLLKALYWKKELYFKVK